MQGRSMKAASTHHDPAEMLQWHGNFIIPHSPSAKMSFMSKMTRLAAVTTTHLSPASK
jgi:hypothetical protein